jgi:TorA maturation chaperone TorD/ferredoxin
METQRSALYQCLAETMAEPPVWLAEPGRKWPLFLAALALSRQSLAARQAVEALLEIDEEPYERRRDRYAQIVSGPGKHEVGMYESGALNGKLLTERTFAVERWYQALGLNIAGAEMPDHASVELAFLAHLAGLEPQYGSHQLEAAFLHQHAGRWLLLLGKRISQSEDDVYAPVGRLLAGWLDEVCTELAVPGFSKRERGTSSTGGRRKPVLRDGETCTLCSFCLQICRAGALAINENMHTTSLFLSPGLCSGCGKCTQVCPSNALIIDQGELPVEGSRILLKSSERALCKGCGQPMISQAEMAYVAAQLDHPDWLEFCPACRFRGVRL